MRQDQKLVLLAMTVVAGLFVVHNELDSSNKQTEPKKAQPQTPFIIDKKTQEKTISEETKSTAKQSSVHLIKQTYIQNELINLNG